MTPSIIINGKDVSNELIEFTHDLVSIQSFSGQEETMARRLAAQMESLGYDEVKIDRLGNVLGRIGSGEKKILFDSHTDTVRVHDESEWQHAPFGGEIIDGYLWGRGSVDMKSGLAASVYAPVVARETGALAGKTVYVSGTVCEESCDGEGLKFVMSDNGIKPDFAIICEPSNNIIATGHKGKAQVIIQTEGVSAHGSAPEKGVNAVYEMAEIIQRIEKLNLELMKNPGRRGTLVLSQISSTGVSINAVPSACEVYLDRRMVVGENEDTVRAEMEGLISGKKANWRIGTLHQPTWTGETLTYQPLHPAWEIALDHPLSKAFIAACQTVFGQAPQDFDYWDFSTNAVAVVAAGIPAIGFGPGEYKLAHMRDEKCAVSQIVEACAVYANVIRLL